MTMRRLYLLVLLPMIFLLVCCNNDDTSKSYYKIPLDNLWIVMGNLSSAAKRLSEDDFCSHHFKNEDMCEGVYDIVKKYDYHYFEGHTNRSYENEDTDVFSTRAYKHDLTGYLDLTASIYTDGFHNFTFNQFELTEVNYERPSNEKMIEFVESILPSTSNKEYCALDVESTHTIFNQSLCNPLPMDTYEYNRLESIEYLNNDENIIRVTLQDKDSLFNHFSYELYVYQNKDGLFVSSYRYHYDNETSSEEVILYMESLIGNHISEEKMSSLYNRSEIISSESTLDEIFNNYMNREIEISMDLLSSQKILSYGDVVTELEYLITINTIDNALSSSFEIVFTRNNDTDEITISFHPNK